MSGKATRRLVDAAERIGRRAGARFHDTGIPQHNPFRARRDLAAAWRRGYYAEAEKPAAGGSR